MGEVGCVARHCLLRLRPRPVLLIEDAGASKADFSSLRRPLVGQEFFEAFYRTVLNAGKYVRQPSYGVDLPQAAGSQ